MGEPYDTCSESSTCTLCSVTDLDLNEVVSKRDSNDSWNDLLLFGSTILAKPKQGGRSRNLTNIVNKRVAARISDQAFIIIPVTATT